MSEQSPEISLEDILLGVEAAWKAHEIEDRLRFPDFKNRVLEVLQNNPNHLGQTTAIYIALGLVAVSYDVFADPIIQTYSALILELNTTLDYASTKIGRGVPGSATLQLPLRFMLDHGGPSEHEAH
jgi:hypothetical protein